MPLALALHIGVRPAVLRLECHQRLLSARIHPQVERSNSQRDDETAGEEDKDGDFARDIVGCVLGEEDFRADDVASAEGEEGTMITYVRMDRLMLARPEADWPRIWLKVYNA